MADQSTRPKRYSPPNERASGTGSHKKSGGRISSQQNKDGGRSQPPGTGSQTEKTAPRVITLKDCSKSEAHQFLSKRWEAAMNLYNDPNLDLSERPVMYGGSVWGKLPHQILASANKTLAPQNKTLPPKDYKSEMRRGLLTPKSSSSVSNN